jgi:phosphate transport system permease protein
MSPASTILPAASEVFAPTTHELKKERRASIAKWTMLGMCIVLAVPLLAIFADIFIKAAPVLSWDYIWLNPANKGIEGGLWSPLVGTFCLVFVSLAIVAPVGILAAIYMVEYARDTWLNRVIGMAVTSLAGVPSIVHALFGLGAFVLFMDLGASLLAASLTIAVMELPVIITATREALGAVPMAFREACWNLGASKWQTIRTVVLPNSLPGILTGVILTVSRTAGETAPILFTGAVFTMRVPDSGFAKFLPYHLGDQFMAMSYHLNMISNQISGMPDEMKFGCAAVLIALILIINSVSIGLRVWLRHRKRW